MTMIVDLIHSLIAMPALALASRIASIFNAKARQRCTGLSGDDWRVPSHIGPTLWVHAASMGEFEQLVPVLQRIRSSRPDIYVVGTAYSPSGFVHQRRSGLVDDVHYLPVDTRGNARRTVRSIDADVLLVGRYDLWRNHILACSAHGTSVVLVNATMPSSGREGPLRSWTADTYRRCSTITAVTDTDAAALHTLTGTAVDVLPDTRYDRITDRLHHPLPDILALRDDAVTTIVLGSSWEPDEDLFLPALQHRDLRLVIVPHEPAEDALQRIERRFPCTRLSLASAATTGHLVVDSVGKLLSLYAIADAAFVGGGFGAGVHSVAEPAGYGIPIACGPRIDRAADAIALRDLGALRVVTTVEEAMTWITTHVIDGDRRRQDGETAGRYISSRAGSSGIIAERIDAALPKRTTEL